MVCTVTSMALSGIAGYPVAAECFLSGGLPAFDIVGLPDAAVRESRERVRAAIKSCGLPYPVSRITVNLAPARLRKEGTGLDLPVFLGILAAAGSIAPPSGNAAFLGELSLTGELRPVTGVLPMALAAARSGVISLYVPIENAPEATLAEGLTVYGVPSAAALLDHLAGRVPLTPAPPWTPPAPDALPLDFSDVKGQENVKRALEIAAAGGHNICLIGPPGSGKSMLARRLPSILPDMTRQEALEATEIHSVMGLTSAERPLLTARPFRSPHHTVSPVALTGGGAAAKPGEISLAHNGVLFLDELPEFQPAALEILRQPLEDGEVHISRAAVSVTYPSRFMLVCAMNPCKCGWYGHPKHPCTCTDAAVAKYRARISGPLLDRIDLYVDVPAVSYGELSRRGASESSAEIRARVNAARARQEARAGTCNARLSPSQTKELCVPDEDGRVLLQAAFDRLGLTGRAYDRILRVARTIADLAGSDGIAASHLAEALQYRNQTPKGSL